MGNCLSASTEQLDPISAEERVKVFTVGELKEATKDFSKELVIGDSFGRHVKGYINPKTLSPAKEGAGMAVAVKRFNLIKDQYLQDWLIDLEFLRRNSHPSLVKLIGYGLDPGMLFIVTEYFPIGSLEDHIYREARPKSLPWETRLNISIGVAQCLAFLHSRKKTSIYRRYLTSSKILLDSDFNAKVSYFGLKNLPSDDESSYVSSVPDEPARFHYSPPEYIIAGNNLPLVHSPYFFSAQPLSDKVTDLTKSTGKLDMPGDVYSFGVILLEMLTGFGKRRIILAKRAIRNDTVKIADMIDPELENNYPHEDGMRMCKIIKQCLEENPKNRPSMQRVLDNLNGIARI